MFSRLTSIQTELPKRIELSRLALKDLGRDRPQAAPLVELTGETATWQIATPNGQPRFMFVRTVPNTAKHGELFVVMVDTEALYAAWLRCSKSVHTRDIDNCVLRSRMPRQRSYTRAAEYFSRARSIGGAVHLAQCAPVKEGKHTAIEFINGVTRTYWLLANRVPAFPLMVLHGRDSAELLNSVAGIGPAPLSFAELFRPTTSGFNTATVNC